MKVLVEVSLSAKNVKGATQEISESEYFIGTRPSDIFKRNMSRSYKKTISFGKSNNGGMSRCKKTYGDYFNEKQRREDKPLHKQHHRHNLQTLEDYIEEVRNHFHYYTPLSDVYDRRRYRDYLRFLDGRKESEELIIEYATRLFKKDKSK